MLQDEEKSGPQIIWWIVACAVIGGAFLTFRPYESARPIVRLAPRLNQTIGSEHVFAHMWEDPFRAVTRSRDMRAVEPKRTALAPQGDQQAEGSESHGGPKATRAGIHTTLAELAGQLGQRVKDKRRIRVLPVLVGGGASPDQSEVRRRERTAILSGLGRLDYTPQLGNRIGVLRTRWAPSKASTDVSLPLLDENDYPVAGEREGWIPYEWFLNREADRDRPTDVLVLWIDASFFSDRTLQHLGWILSRLIGDKSKAQRRVWDKDEGALSVCMIGPPGSSMAQALAREAKAAPESLATNSRADGRAESGSVTSGNGRVIDARYSKPKPSSGGVLGAWEVVGRMHVINSRATADLTDPSYDHLGDVLACSVTSTVRDDGVILGEVVDELWARDIHIGQRDAVAVVTEWDTSFGRTLPHRLREKSEEHVNSLSGEEPYEAERIREFHYLRGLDGRHSVDERLELEDLVREMQRVDPSRAGDGSSAGDFERPFGTSQFDYVRRIVNNLVEWDRKERQEGRRLRAVGVLGSDVYDKILIMRAVREKFPRIQFFTTDLDARLADPRYYRWTRNLLVGSSYGLKLSRELQGAIPPFRNSYQTASFVASQLAVGGLELQDKRAVSWDDPVAWHGANDGPAGSSGQCLVGWDKAMVRPRLFEIGRRGAYDISVVPDPKRGAEVGLQPELRKGRPTARTVKFAVFLLVATFLFVAPLLASRAALREDGRWQGFLSELREHPVCVALLVALIVGVAGLVYLNAQEQRREPFEFLEGISVWPTILIRLVVVAIGAVFALRMRHRLRLNQDKIEQRYFPGQTFQRPSWKDWWEHLGQLWRGEKWKGLADYRRSIGISGWSCEGERGAGVDGDPNSGRPKRIDPVQLWREYITRTGVEARATRIAVPAVAFLLIAVFLHLLYPWRQPPTRGGMVAVLECVSFWVAGLVTILLTCAVIDATRLFQRFAFLLSTNSSSWSDRSRLKCSERCGLTLQGLRHYIDLELIGDRSEMILRLIMYPFILVTLLIIGRNPFFDAWTWTPSLIVTGLLLFLSALWAAVSLRLTAERARKHTVERVARRIRKERQDKSDSPEIAALEDLLDRTQHLTIGAFAPYRSSPVLRAFLLPFGGIGAFSLLDAFHLLGS